MYYVFVLLVVGIAACCGIDHVYASSRVVTFKPCNPINNYQRFDQGAAIIEVFNDGRPGGRVNWNFCAATPTPLMYVRSMKLQFKSNDGSMTLATYDIPICNEAGTDCLAQLRSNARTDAACLSGSKQLPWLTVPVNAGPATVSLIEPSNNNKAIAQFCS